MHLRQVHVLRFLMGFFGVPWEYDSYIYRYSTPESCCALYPSKTITHFRSIYKLKTLMLAACAKEQYLWRNPYRRRLQLTTTPRTPSSRNIRIMMSPLARWSSLTYLITKVCQDRIGRHSRIILHIWSIRLGQYPTFLCSRFRKHRLILKGC